MFYETYLILCTIMTFETLHLVIMRVTTEITRSCVVTMEEEEEEKEK